MSENETPIPQPPHEPWQQPIPQPPAQPQQPMPQWAQPTAPPQSTPRRPVAAIVTAVVCAVLAVACAATALTYFVKYTDERSTTAIQRNTITGLQQDLSGVQVTTDREKAALKASCDFLEIVSTYDFANLDSYFDKVLAASTGSWHQNFSSSMSSLKQAMVNVQSRSHPEEFHCGLTKIDGNTATAVGIVKQSRSNNVTPTDSLTVPAVLTLVEQPDGRWLVSDMNSPAI